MLRWLLPRRVKRRSKYFQMRIRSVYSMAGKSTFLSYHLLLAGVDAVSKLLAMHEVTTSGIVPTEASSYSDID